MEIENQLEIEKLLEIKRKKQEAVEKAKDLVLQLLERRQSKLIDAELKRNQAVAQAKKEESDLIQEVEQQKLQIQEIYSEKKKIFDQKNDLKTSQKTVKEQKDSERRLILTWELDTMICQRKRQNLIRDRVNDPNHQNLQSFNSQSQLTEAVQSLQLVPMPPSMHNSLRVGQLAQLLHWQPLKLSGDAIVMEYKRRYPYQRVRTEKLGLN
ncbi:MAG: hypothetical protein EZS28_044588 [Streblomastix strix]|uniref:Uncharacterized protein n=1 Tax=Streblomastix strix TaxID=222440 RepID=A0A5J4TR95_9EUKA|nr:MAG: hypothetical protein EZS28_044588 [Streblomastix strix]